MSSKLIPSNPSEVMVIRKVTPNIITCSAPFSRFGLFKVGGRGTIVRLRSGSLAVFASIALTPEVRESLTSLGGPVKYLIAPDAEHHIFMTQWASAFPAAALLGPDGLAEKRARSQEPAGTHFQHVFTAANKDTFRVDADFDADFDYEFVHSHGNKELVFNYRPDRTLIEADLLFNLPAREQYSRAGVSATAGVLTGWFVGLMSAEGSAVWQKRFNWYVASAMDRRGFNRSVRKIERFDFDRIIPCHGDVIESGGKGIFRKVFEWHLNAARKED